MQTTSDFSWDDLKSQYYHNLETLHNSINAAHNSSLELYRIYSQVMKKSENTSPAVLKKFTESWLNKLDVENTNSFSSIEKIHKPLLDNPSPTVTDLNMFEQTLQSEFKDKSLFTLSAYYLAMKGFYDTWMDMWSK
ncbi:MAG: hypothetical protein PVI88_02010 [Nitrosopumilaceae archaeon]|jgi:hypothetical protein